MGRTDQEVGVFQTLFVSETFSPPAGSLTNAMIVAGAGISASKLELARRAVYPQTSTAATATAVLAIIRGTSGTSIAVEVTNATACSGSSTVTVDVQKNGVSILSSTITLNSSTSTTVPVAGTVGTTTLADGDIITAVITANQSGTDALATGVAVQFDYNEDYEAA